MIMVATEILLNNRAVIMDKLVLVPPAPSVGFVRHITMPWPFERLNWYQYSDLQDIRGRACWAVSLQGGYAFLIQKDGERYTLLKGPIAATWKSEDWEIIGNYEELEDAKQACN